MRTAVVATVLCLSVICLSVAADVEAAMRKPTDIPAQALRPALQMLSKDRDFQLVFRTDLVGELRTGGAVGDLTLDEALKQLLKGTDLTYAYLDEKTVTIIPVATAPLSDASGAAPANPSVQPRPAIEGPKVPSDRFRLAQLDQGTTPGSDSVEKGQAFEKKEKKADQLEEVVVTGTHIRGAAPIGAPITIIDSADIAQSGYTTTEQLIQSLPGDFRGGAAGASADQRLSSGVNATFNSSYGSGVNLRGLGSTATLVLVNGHRVASSGSGYFTDISTIPISAIDHIDVLTDGASAIYGSEAIAGVVNIVLKKDSEGLEVGLRYGGASGFSTDGAYTEIGHQWTGGGFTLGSDFSHGSSLDVSQRPYTASVPGPTSIFPSYKQTAVSTSIHQTVADMLEVHADAQYSTSSKEAYNSVFSTIYRDTPATDRWSASAGASFQLSHSWSVHYDVSSGAENNRPTEFQLATGAPAAFYDETKTLSRFTDQNLSASGELLPLPGGNLRIALGLDYRSEGFDTNNITPFSVAPYSVGRIVKAAYAEIYIPIFGDLNSVPGIKRLTLSAAVRHDRYSDFGNTTNPKYGISWSPVDGFELRGAYSTSFRAPATGTELLNSKLGVIAAGVEAFPGPDESAAVPVFELLGGRPNLQPETATNATVGFDFKPSFIPSLSVSFNYYDISYSKQLATPPYVFDPLNDPAIASVITHYPDSSSILALLSAAQAAGAQIYDFTGGAFGPNPYASTVYLYDLREQNLSTTKTSGFDVSANYRVLLGGDRLDTRVAVTHIDKFSTEVAAGAPDISTLNTVGNPASVRLRGQETWSRGTWSLSAAANYVGKYKDTSATTPVDVGSFATVDVAARYEVSGTSVPGLHGLVAALAVSNVFDRAPPYVTNGTLGLFPGSHYDPANSDPTGRLITLALTKRW
jgi:iron complex outermembrane receptor protein